MSQASDRLPYGLSAPAIVAILALVAVPLALTFALSLYPLLPDNSIGTQLTLSNYQQVVGDGYYRSIFARTFWMATLVTDQSALTLLTLPAVVRQIGHHSAQK